MKIRRVQSSGWSTLGMVGLGLVFGAAVGLAGWSLVQRRHRRSLFSRDKVKRLAALGYLQAHPSVDSAQLLRDYLQWEPHPLLRRRARGVLQRTERALRT
jgi:hypothetical protein